ncbi:hypothetical protein [Mesorhizobium sp.]|uniref:hypothetical protein n=1 Tax=Mesorhizobium sp. TaxID=1871066 RepID=UPI000FE5B04E|nr:hypothetical protein [Mesorhizobium sp.]RWO22199.1 MAG: hypothetical protein EOS09_21435 [Mesorhizobium sp.]RWQ46774.1 MAG: hypothetical protein EOS83_28735 [Mesorhizobium sp.]
MAIDAAVKEALDATLAEATDQPEDFKRRFRRLITLVLNGNYEDSDVRNVMDSIHVVVQSED